MEEQKNLKPVEVVEPQQWENLNGGSDFMIGPEDLAKAPTLALKVIRLVGEFPDNFEIDQDVAQAIAEVSDQIQFSESTAVEVQKIFETSRSAQELVKHERLMDRLFPELVDCRGVTQPSKYHSYDVYDHQLASMVAIDKAMEVLPTDYQKKINDHLTMAGLLRLTALLHDIGKPDTRTVTDTGIHFYGHEKNGAEMVSDRLKVLCMPEEVNQKVSYLVARHLYPLSVYNNAVKPTVGLAKRIPEELLTLSLADFMGKDLTKDSFGEYRDYLLELSDLKSKSVEPPAPVGSRVINGHQIMESFGLEPGKKVGELLRYLDRQPEQIKDRNQALEILRQSGLV